MKHQFRSVLVTLALVALASSGLAGENSSKKLRRAPDFVLSDWQGKKVALKDLRGQVVLLEFFRTTCPACRDEAPMLERLYRDYKDKGVTFIGISHDEAGAELVEKFAKQFNVTYPLLIGDLEVAVRYVGITPQNSSFDIPQFFLINREGYIVQHVVAGRDVEFFHDERGGLERAIQELLVDSPPRTP